MGNISLGTAHCTVEVIRRGFRSPLFISNMPKVSIPVLSLKIERLARRAISCDPFSSPTPNSVGNFIFNAWLK